jgi:hypothetical protein
MRQLMSVGVTAAILMILYWLIDRAAIMEALAKTDVFLLALSLALLVLLICTSAFRLHLLAHYGGFVLSAPAAVQSTFAANALNLFLPG